MDSKLLDKLNKRKKEGTLRSLSSFDGLIDFYSNDYLGLSKIKTLESSNQFGSTGSRLISGNSREANNCERFLAEFFSVEAALVFNSGYNANLGFFSAVPQRGDTILYDEKIHASIREGISLSLANSFSFKHNSLNDLKGKIKRAKNSIYIVIESLYSMDGDKAPLIEMVNLSEENGAYLIVDEAHACGVFGENGKGLVCDLGLNNRIFARIITFGKAYGAHGASVLGSQKLIEFLINFSRSFIYTTALPPNEYSRIQQIVQLKELEARRLKLYENIVLFRNLLKIKTLHSDANSPIQMIEINHIEQLNKTVLLLQNSNFAVKPIFSPSVKKGEEGIRICIHSFNSAIEIENICRILNDMAFKVNN